jgi:Holliday junction resolvase RusA-like endonuclease
MSDSIIIFIPGIPRPGGSKTATVIRRKGGEIVMKNGRPLITTRDDAKGNPEWKQTVAYFARKQYDGPPLCGALRLEVTFTMPRLRGHFGSGRNAEFLKPSAPAFHTVKPDCTKLLRALEDSLTGILWRDDALIAHQAAQKIYGDRPGAQIKVTELSEQGAPMEEGALALWE